MENSMQIPVKPENKATIQYNNSIPTYITGKTNILIWKDAGTPMFISVHFSSVTQSCPTLCDPISRITPGLPIHHQLPEFTQTHVHWVHDAIQSSHPLLSPSAPARIPSQHQGLFQWVNSSHEMAKVLVSALASFLSMNTQDWSPVGWTGWTSL